VRDVVQGHQPRQQRTQGESVRARLGLSDDFFSIKKIY
jgi:hypothetical protein